MRIKWYIKKVKDTLKAMRLVSNGESLILRRKRLWDKYLELNRAGKDKMEEARTKAQVDLLDSILNG